MPRALIHFRIDIHRNRAAQNQRVDDAFMDIAGQDDLIPALAGGKRHTLDRAGGNAHHKKSVDRAEGVRRQFFRLMDHRYRVTKIVQGLHTVYIHSHALLTQEGGRIWISPTSLVSRHVEGNLPHLPERLQRLINGCTALIGMHLRIVQFFTTPSS